MRFGKRKHAYHQDKQPGHPRPESSASRVNLAIENSEHRCKYEQVGNRIHHAVDSGVHAPNSECNLSGYGVNELCVEVAARVKGQVSPKREYYRGCEVQKRQCSSLFGSGIFTGGPSPTVTIRYSSVHSIVTFTFGQGCGLPPILVSLSVGIAVDLARHRGDF